MEAQLREEALQENFAEMVSEAIQSDVPTRTQKEKKIVYKGSILPSMVNETPAAYGAEICGAFFLRPDFAVVSHWKANDRYYVSEKGMDTVRSHAVDFVKRGLHRQLFQMTGNRHL